MNPSSTLSGLLAANETFSTTYKRDPTLQLPSKKSYALITCMDPRIDFSAVLGIELGDAAIIRNAGGSAQIALADAAVTGLIGTSPEIIILKHTGTSDRPLQHVDVVSSPPHSFAKYSPT